MRIMEVGQKIIAPATARSPGSTLLPGRASTPDWRSQPELSPTCILYYDFGPRSSPPRRFLTTFILLADAEGRARGDTEDADDRDKVERIERDMIGQPNVEAQVEEDFDHAKRRAFCSEKRFLLSSRLKPMFSIKSA